MAKTDFKMDDYNTVPERIGEFRAKYPDGCLRPARLETPYEIEVIDGQTYIVVVAAAYRHPEDLLPGIGMAWEPFPGKTPFTKESELMNAETGAWGRAIVAALAADAKKGIATQEDIQRRAAEQNLPDVQLCPRCKAEVHGALTDTDKLRQHMVDAHSYTRGDDGKVYPPKETVAATPTPPTPDQEPDPAPTPDPDPEPEPDEAGDDPGDDGTGDGAPATAQERYDLIAAWLDDQKGPALQKRAREDDVPLGGSVVELRNRLKDHWYKVLFGDDPVNESEPEPDDGGESPLSVEDQYTPLEGTPSTPQQQQVLKDVIGGLAEEAHFDAWVAWRMEYQLGGDVSEWDQAAVFRGLEFLEGLGV